MAQLKDLIVDGASRFLNTITFDKLNLPTASSGSTYGPGTAGQILTTNGTSVYWGNGIGIATHDTLGGIKPDETTITVDTSTGIASVNGVTEISVKDNDTKLSFDSVTVAELCPVATTSVAGKVKPDGTTITVDGDGTIHGNSQYTLPTATSSTLGGIVVGSNLTINASTGKLDAIDTTYTAGTNVQINGSIISATDTVYTLPTATTSVLGGIKSDPNGTITVNASTGVATANYRNITVSTTRPTSGDGNDGDIWLVYTT